MGACPGLAQLGSEARFAILNINHCMSHLFARYSIGAYCRYSHGDLIVVITVPLLSYTLHFLYAPENVRVKYSPSVTAVESFYISVLGRISRPGIQNTHIVPLALFLKILWNELRAVITFDVFRLAIQLNYLSQCLLPFLPGKTSKPSGTPPPYRCHPLCSVLGTSFCTPGYHPQNP